MVRLFTASQMRLADRLAAESGVPGIELMENAGQAVAVLAAEAARTAAGITPGAGSAGPVTTLDGPVTVLVGKGNNGGDGLVAARLLIESGLAVEVVLAEAGESFGGDALANLKALVEGDFAQPRVFGAGVSAEELLGGLRCSTVVIDALLGTGSKGAPREPVATIIGLLNRAIAGGGKPPGAPGPPAVRPPATGRGPAAARPFVVAVDLPSGLDADTGIPAGLCVRADATVALGGVKTGLARPEAAGLVGRLYLDTIGIPDECLDRAWREPPGLLHWLLPREAATLLPARPVAGHKGTFGHVWVVAGSPGFTGAAVLAGLGALRAGAGLATVACPEGCRSIVAAALPEVLTKGLPQGPDGRLDYRSVEEVASTLDGAGRGKALVVGPGLGATPATCSLVVGLLREPTRRLPAIYDADALNALALNGPQDGGRLLAEHGRGEGEPPVPPLVLTPHPGEMSRLLGRPVPDIQTDRVGAAREAARAWGAVVVLKGAGTVVASPDGPAWINATGNPGMATGGSGDVLAGAIGAFLAQGLPPLEAALAGVSAHGLAGDIAARDVGSRGLLASDIARYLPRAMDTMGLMASAEEAGEGGPPADSPAGLPPRGPAGLRAYGPEILPNRHNL